MDQQSSAGLPVDYRQLVEGMGDGVIACNAAGEIILWNAAATRIFGFSEDEALGQSLDLIIPERQRKRHWDGYDKTMRTGETRYGADLLRVPALHRDGKPLSIAFTVAMLHSPEQAVTAIVAVVRDETARWTEERNLRQRITQLEAGLVQTGA
jgi:PAS domain S-box-containing protein